MTLSVLLSKRMRGLRLRKALARKRGVALVEFAVVLGVLVLILLGIMDLGYVFFVQHNMVNAARDAARVVAVRDGTSGQGVTAAQNRLNGIPLEFNIAVTTPDTSGIPGDRDVTVVITTPLNAASFGLMKGQLTANATMRLEEDES